MFGGGGLNSLYVYIYPMSVKSRSHLTEALQATEPALRLILNELACFVL